MTYFLARHKVEDYDKWRVIYDEAQSTAASMGQKNESSMVFKDIDDPNRVTVLGEFDTKENAEKFFGSEELKAAMQKAGVQGPPEIHFVDKV